MRIINAWICQIKNRSINPVFGELLFNDGKIEEINPTDAKELSKVKIGKEDIDAGGRVVTVPNINFHDHFYSRLAKGLTITITSIIFLRIFGGSWI
jgi:cytosine/adenosine deaminase-related metal-dependent hydrolase